MFLEFRYEHVLIDGVRTFLSESHFINASSDLSWQIRRSLQKSKAVRCNVSVFVAVALGASWALLHSVRRWR